MNKLLSSFIATLLTINAANAIVTYSIDTVANTILFNGSTNEGTPVNAKGQGDATWRIETDVSTGSGGIGDVSGSVASSASTVNSYGFRVYTTMVGDPVGLGMDVRMSDQTPTTITFTNLVVDYGGQDAPIQAYIESQLGTATISLFSGTGFGNIVSSVPEPATYALMASVAALGLCVVRRRRLKA